MKYVSFEDGSNEADARRSRVPEEVYYKQALMDITPLTPKDKLSISHYGDGGFVVNGTPHKGNIIITLQNVFAWEAGGLDDAAPESLAPLFAGEVPEIVIVGAGARFNPLPPRLRMLFRDKGVASDAMDTGAACRTYSVLLAEGRLVCAALIAV